MRVGRVTWLWIAGAAAVAPSCVLDRGGDFDFAGPGSGSGAAPGLCTDESQCTERSDCRPSRCVSGMCQRETAPEGTVCSDDGGELCDGGGRCVRNDGSACSSGPQCKSGHCADGVCCDEACSNDCESCSAR